MKGSHGDEASLSLGRSEILHPSLQGRRFSGLREHVGQLDGGFTSRCVSWDFRQSVSISRKMGEFSSPGCLAWQFRFDWRTPFWWIPVFVELGMDWWALLRAGFLEINGIEHE